MINKKFNQYKLLYYAKVIKNIFHRHHIKSEDYPQPVERFFTLTPELKSQWDSLFEVTELGREVPLSYFLRETESAFVLFDFMNNFDLNLANLLHIKCSLWLGDHSNYMKEGETYRVVCSVNDVVHVTDHRVCLVVKGSVFHQATNKHIYDMKNGFIIKKIQKEEVVLFDHLPHQPKHHADLYCDLSHKKPTLLHEKDVTVFPITIPKNLGKRYGELSGDYNPLHTSHTIARLTGAKESFIQGLCAINLILSAFFKQGHHAFEKINITYCQKFYEQQTIKVLVKEHHFEVIDDNQQLLAYGRFHEEMDI